MFIITDFSKSLSISLAGQVSLKVPVHGYLKHVNNTVDDLSVQS